MSDEDYNVDKYLHAAQIIEQLEAEKVERWGWWRRTTLTTHLEWSPIQRRDAACGWDHVLGVFITRGTDMARKVEDIDAACEIIDQRIARWQMRAQLFNAYLSALPPEDANTIATDYTHATHGLRNAVQDELWEIETYVAYHFGYEPPEDQIDITGNLSADVTSLADFFSEVSE